MHPIAINLAVGLLGVFSVSVLSEGTAVAQEVEACLRVGELKVGDCPDEGGSGAGTGSNQTGCATPTHTVVISSQNVGGETDYTLSGGGGIEQVSGKLDGFDISVQQNDTVSGNTANGHVANANDGFEICGALPKISVKDPGHAEVYVDGQQYMYTVVISGRNQSGGTGYTIHGGRIEQISGHLDGHAVSIQKNDNVSGDTANGHVAGAADGYAVFGGWPQVSLQNAGNADVYIDGRKQ